MSFWDLAPGYPGILHFRDNSPRADELGSATIKSSLMPKSRSNRKPTFLWQAVLIVLPVIALAVMGSLSLRQDRLLVEQQARAQAQEIADDLVARLWTALTNLPAATSRVPANVVDPTAAPSLAVRLLLSATGELLDPSPIPDLIPHPLDSASLDDRQAELWQTAREAEFREGDLTRAAEAWEQFLQDNPPETFAAAARLNLGIVLSRQGRLDSALGELARAVTNHSDAMLESGLPLPTVAGLKWLEAAAHLPELTVRASPDWLQLLCSNAVVRPTLLSVPLLNAAAEADKKFGGRRTRSWRDLWERHEQSRSLVPAVRRQLFADEATIPLAPSRVRPFEFRLFWVGHESAWLALTETNESANLPVVCEPEEMIAFVLQATIGRSRNLPRYFRVDVELAGRRLTPVLWSRLDVRQTASRNAVAKPIFVTPNGKILAQVDPGAEAGLRTVLPRVHSNLRRTLQGDLLATARKTVGSTEALRIGVYLQDRAQLFAQQRTRSLWFGGLIAVTAVVALVGLATAWRAFARQLRLNEMKSNFVSSVSHELRAPIASVRLLAESLERGTVADPGRQAEYFKLIVQECRRLGALITNVLDFSRIDQGRKQYEFEPTDLTALVQQTVQLMEPYAAERQVGLQVSLDPSSLVTRHSSLNLDGRALQQALVNLLDNAIKHAPAATTVTVGLESDQANAERGMRNAEPGGRRSEVGSRRSEAGSRKAERGTRNAELETRNSEFETSTSRLATRSEPEIPGRILIWVEDSGAGIPPEEHARIFEPFYRRGSELRRETQGVGIGLTIVKHVVEAHGGRVTVRSAVGQGSRFTIELPANPNARGETSSSPD